MKTIDFLMQELDVFITLPKDAIIFSGTRGDVILKANKLTLSLPGEDDFDLPLRLLPTALFYIKLPPYEPSFMER